MNLNNHEKLKTKCKKELYEIITFLEGELEEQFGTKAKITVDTIEGIIIRVLIQLYMRNGLEKDTAEYNFVVSQVTSSFNNETETFQVELAEATIVKYFSGAKSLYLLGLDFSQVLGLLHQCLLEKSNLRKQDGIYYTPRTIVEFMVEKTLNLFFAEVLVELREAVCIRDKEKIYFLFKKVRSYRVIDPACGSGAFLTFVFDRFISFYSDISGVMKLHDFEQDPDLVEISAANILERHIRGIDIDPDAIRLTRLALFYHALDTCGGRFTQIFNTINNIIINGDSLACDIDNKFDLVIGNPPYVANKCIPKTIKNNIAQRFQTARGQYDTIVPFIEQGLSFLKDDGVLCYITSNKFMAADYGYELRQRLLKEISIKELIDVSAQRIFSDASAYPVILVLQKKKPERGFLTRITFDETSSIPQDIFLNLGKSVITTDIADESLPPIKKILQWPGRVDSSSIYCGIASTGFNKQMTSNSGHGMIKIALSGDIGNYSIAAINRYFPLKQLKGNQKYHFSGTKLVIPGMTKNLKAAIDLEGMALGRVYFIPCQTGICSPEPWAYYLLALYNSAVLDFFYRLLYWPVHLSGGYLRVNSTYLASLPIPYWERGRTKHTDLTMKIIALSQKIVESLQAGDEARELQAGLQVEIFKLYGLDQEDAAIILRHLNYDREWTEQILIQQLNKTE